MPPIKDTDMLALVIFIILAVLVLLMIELRERKRQVSPRPASELAAATERPEGCCGEHLVCERDTLFSTTPEIVYYDDEELDALAGKAAEDYTESEQTQIKDVFYSLNEADVAGWCRSLQMRNISLPIDIRDEALLIVREQRNANNH